MSKLLVSKFEDEFHTFESKLRGRGEMFCRPPGLGGIGHNNKNAE